VKKFTYATQSGSDILDYDWTFSGAEGTDYNIITENDYTVTLVWLTDGQKKQYQSIMRIQMVAQVKPLQSVQLI
jgi:hypothetical protein